MENREYREKRALLVKHSTSDLYNNNRNNIVEQVVTKLANNDRNRKLSSLQQIRDWAPDSEKAGPMTPSRTRILLLGTSPTTKKG